MKWKLNEEMDDFLQDNEKRCSLVAIAFCMCDACPLLKGGEYLMDVW